MSPQRATSYRGKIMLVAFLGTHAPLLAAALYLLLGSLLDLGAALRTLWAYFTSVDR